MIEIWKDIPGYEGSYKVSNKGRVLSLDRVLKDGRKWRGRELRGYIAPDGYHVVELSGIRYGIHRLVMLAFVGLRPSDMDVCHDDGFRKNNVITNLRYDTRKGNFADKHRHGTVQHGENNGMSKLTSHDVSDLFNRLGAGETQTKIAKSWGVHTSTINKIVSGDNWKHHPDKRYVQQHGSGCPLNEEIKSRMKELLLGGYERRDIANKLEVSIQSVHKYLKGL